MAFYRGVNHQRKFIVFFSPKCGCTTLKAWFRTITPSSLPEDNRNIPEPYRSNWLNPKQVHDDFFDSYRKILFVRNPFHRLVSFYNLFIVQSRPQYTGWRFADEARTVDLEDCSFAEFLSHALAIHEDTGQELQHHLIPQSFSTENIAFDRVLGVDDMNAALQRLSAWLRIEADTELNLNRSQYDHDLKMVAYDHKPRTLRKTGVPEYGYFYNEALKDVVRKIYTDDFAIFEQVLTSIASKNQFVR